MHSELVRLYSVKTSFTSAAGPPAKKRIANKPLRGEDCRRCSSWPKSPEKWILQQQGQEKPEA